MKEIYAEVKTISLPVVVAVFSAALCLLTASAALAQGSRGTPPTSVERRQELSNRQASDYEIDKSSRDLKKPSDRPADRKRTQEVAGQIKHDFEGLQERHNQIVLFMVDKEGLNHNHDAVFRAVAEIKKYATRLKTNLALPKPQPEKNRVETNNEQIPESLMTLRKHIYNFVTNPLFETAGVLDLEQGKKAGFDLDRIIELSESISKSVDKRKQPPRP